MCVYIYIYIYLYITTLKNTHTHKDSSRCNKRGAARGRENECAHAREMQKEGGRESARARARERQREGRRGRDHVGIEVLGCDVCVCVCMCVYVYVCVDHVGIEVLGCEGFAKLRECNSHLHVHTHPYFSSEKNEGISGSCMHRILCVRPTERCPCALPLSFFLFFLPPSLTLFRSLSLSQAPSSFAASSSSTTSTLSRADEVSPIYTYTT